MSQAHELTTLNFLQVQMLYKTEKPFELIVQVPKDNPDQRQTNMVFERREQKIIDVRGIEDQHTLDGNAFVYVKDKTQFNAFDDREAIENEYLPAIEQLIQKQVDQADRVFIFDWRIRCADFKTRTVNLNDKSAVLPPSTTVHIDQSPLEAIRRIKLFLKDEAATLLGGRVRIVNAWRPIHSVIKDRPLTVCDGSTVDESDIVMADIVRRDFVRETAYVIYNETQRWYYKSHQDVEDVVLFKIFDSDTDVKARFCPHTSFQHKSVLDSAPPRQSIEVRAFIFSDIA